MYTLIQTHTRTHVYILRTRWVVILKYNENHSLQNYFNLLWVLPLFLFFVIIMIIFFVRFFCWCCWNFEVDIKQLNIAKILSLKLVTPLDPKMTFVVTIKMIRQCIAWSHGQISHTYVIHIVIVLFIHCLLFNRYI